MKYLPRYLRSSQLSILECGDTYRGFVVDLIANHSYVEVVEQSRASFLAGLALYDRRPDKSYSLVDCISMQLLKAEDLWEVLTSDNHFAQEGFTMLLREQQ